jgi:hypothetical protein
VSVTGTYKAYLWKVGVVGVIKERHHVTVEEHSMHEKAGYRAVNPRKCHPEV